MVRQLEEQERYKSVIKQIRLIEKSIKDISPDILPYTNKRYNQLLIELKWKRSNKLLN